MNFKHLLIVFGAIGLWVILFVFVAPNPLPYYYVSSDFVLGFLLRSIVATGLFVGLAFGLTSFIYVATWVNKK